MQFDWKAVPLYKFGDQLPYINTSFSQLSRHINGGFVHILLLIFFILYCIGYAIYSGILFYHWHAYGMHTKRIMIAQIIFSVVTIVVGVTLFLLILSF